MLEQDKQKRSPSLPLYDPAEGIESSLHTIATEIYGAKGVELSNAARKDLQFLKDNGWDTLPVCISKTQYSFTDDASALGAPTGHILHVRQLVPRIGAGFIVALTGDVMTLPGLPKHPAAEGSIWTDPGRLWACSELDPTHRCSICLVGPKALSEVLFNLSTAVPSSWDRRTFKRMVRTP